MAYFEFENDVTPINDTNLNNMQKGIAELLLPVGSTYVTPTNTNPNTILGFGEWERLKGRVCVGLDENDTDFNTIGKTGGEKTHTLTINEMPAHTHKIRVRTSSSPGDYYGDPSMTNANAGTLSNGGDTTSTGRGQAFNITQPYRVVGYMWIRIA